MSTDTPAEKQTFEQKVNTVVDSMVQGDDGNWALPEGSEASEEVLFTATLEKRRRDTQSSYGKSQKRQKTLEAENKQLTEGWSKHATTSMTAEQRDELDTLKTTDPDAWRAKLNEIEQANNEAFEETRKEITTKASTESELEYRERAMTEFVEANPEIALTDDVIANDLPPRYLKKLEAGKCTFGEFLNDAKEYLAKGKVLKTEEIVDDISLGKASGSSTPSSKAVEAAAVASYDKETY